MLLLTCAPATEREVRGSRFPSTGLPEAWGTGKGGVRFAKGTFSWAARGRGPLPPVRSRVELHRGLFNETIGPFLASSAAAADRRPLAFANIDCDLYAGALDALRHLGPRMCAGTRLHFHELLHDRVLTARKLKSHRPTSELSPSDEARALYEWLRQQPGAELELVDVVSTSNSEAAAFVVRAFPGGPCAASAPASALGVQAMQAASVVPGATPGGTHAPLPAARPSTTDAVKASKASPPFWLCVAIISPFVIPAVLLIKKHMGTNP